MRRAADLGDHGSPRVTLSVTCCALEEGQRARELARRRLAFYVGAMGTYYRESLCGQRHGETAREVAAAWANGDRSAAVDAVSVCFPRGASTEEIEETLEALAPGSG